VWTALHLQYDWFFFGEVFSIGLLFGYLRYRSNSTWLTPFCTASITSPRRCRPCGSPGTGKPNRTSSACWRVTPPAQSRTLLRSAFTKVWISRPEQHVIGQPFEAVPLRLQPHQAAFQDEVEHDQQENGSSAAITIAIVSYPQRISRKLVSRSSAPAE